MYLYKNKQVMYYEFSFFLSLSLVAYNLKQTKKTSI